MNLVESLIKADSKKADELETGTFMSKKLARIVGSEEPVEVTIKEIPARRLQELIAKQFDKNGNFNISKAFGVKALVAGEAVTNPSLKNEELQAHFGCSTSKDLAIKLFGLELNALSDKVCELAGLEGMDDTDDEIKN